MSPSIPDPTGSTEPSLADFFIAAPEGLPALHYRRSADDRIEGEYVCDANPISVTLTDLVTAARKHLRGLR